MSLTETFLSREEVKALTDRTNRSSQGIVLRAMGIEHRVRPDGSVAILRAHITKVFDGDVVIAKKTKVSSPNWDAV